MPTDKEEQVPYIILNAPFSHIKIEASTEVLPQIIKALDGVTLIEHDPRDNTERGEVRSQEGHDVQPR